MPNAQLSEDFEALNYGAYAEASWATVTTANSVHFSLKWNRSGAARVLDSKERHVHPDD